MQRAQRQQVGGHRASALFGGGDGGRILALARGADRSVGYGVGIALTRAVLRRLGEQVAQSARLRFNRGVLRTGSVTCSHRTGGTAERGGDGGSSTAARDGRAFC